MPWRVGPPNPTSRDGMRQIILDTETTGLSWEKGNRVVEIGCIEYQNRRPTGRTFHTYLNPEREMEPGAAEVTGLTLDFLADKPLFSEVADDFLRFIEGAELVIHNAEFDVGFLNAELGRLQRPCGRIADYAGVLDTLKLHGALLDAELLAEVYLMMTSGQAGFGFDADPIGETHAAESRVGTAPVNTVVLSAGSDELESHSRRMQQIANKSGKTLWPD